MSDRLGEGTQPLCSPPRARGARNLASSGSFTPLTLSLPRREPLTPGGYLRPPARLPAASLGTSSDLGTAEGSRSADGTSPLSRVATSRHARAGAVGLTSRCTLTPRREPYIPPRSLKGSPDTRAPYLSGSRPLASLSHAGAHQLAPPPSLCPYLLFLKPRFLSPIGPVGPPGSGGFTPYLSRHALL